MYILVPVWLQVLQGLALLPFAIYVVLLARQHSARQEALGEVLRLEIARLRGYMSSLGSQLDEIQTLWPVQGTRAAYHDIQRVDPTPALPVPAPASIPTPAEFVGQLTPNQLSVLLRGLGMRAGVELPTFLQSAPRVQLDSLPESLVKDPSQEPKISNGGE